MNNWFKCAFGVAMAFAALLLITPPTLAQSACEGVTGKAGGICTAYCEANDCDGVPEASQKACNALLDNWNRLTGLTMPCLVDAAVNPLLDGSGFTSICPFDDELLFPATTVGDICESLGLDVDFFLPNSIDNFESATTGDAATSANICLCPGRGLSIERCFTGRTDDFGETTDPCRLEADGTTVEPTPVIRNVDSITDLRVGNTHCQWKTINWFGTDYEVLLCDPT